MFLRQAFRAHARTPALVGLGIVLCLGLALLTWMFYGSGDVRVAANVMALSVGFLLMQITASFFHLVLTDLGQPAQTCLVPGTRQRMRVVAAGLWLLFAAAAGGLHGFANGHIWVGMVLVGFMLNRAIAGMTGSHWHFAAMAAWPFVEFDAFSSPAILLPLSLLVALDAWHGITLLVGAGGDRHFGRVEKSRRTAYLLKEGATQSSVAGDIALAAGSSAHHRVAIGINMFQPRRKYVKQALLCSVLLAMIVAIDLAYGDLGKHAASTSGSTAMLILVVIGHRANELKLNLAKTVPEQQVLALAPGYPRGVGANRLVLRVLLVQWLLAWMGVLFFGAALFSIGSDGGTIRIFCASALGAMAMLPALFNEDLAMDQRPDRYPKWTVYLLQLLLFIAATVLERRLLPFAGVAIGALIGLGGLFMARRYWLERVGGAELLPVGARAAFGIDMPGRAVK